MKLDNLFYDIKPNVVRFIYPNAEGTDPIDEFSNPEAVRTWMNWVYNTNLFNVGDIMLGLVKYGDKFVVCSVQRVDATSDVLQGVRYTSTELPEYQEMCGRVIVDYTRKKGEQNCKRFYADIRNDLLISEIKASNDRIF